MISSGQPPAEVEKVIKDTDGNETTAEDKYVEAAKTFLMKSLNLERPRESVLLRDLRHIFPELIYMANDPYDKSLTLGGLLTVYWIVTDQFSAFTRGQNLGDRLQKSSWADLQNRLRRSGAILHDTEGPLLAVFVYMVLRRLGHVHVLQEAFVNETSIWRGNSYAISYESASMICLGLIMDNHSIILPSFHHLETKWKNLLKKNLANKIFGYLARCEGKFCTTTLNFFKKSCQNRPKCSKNAGKFSKSASENHF